MAETRKSRVASYTLSLAADRDAEALLRYSITLWRDARAERYMLDLHRVFQTFADFPALGRDIAHIRPGYLRFEHESHAIFYQPNATGIIIVRILHRRQRPETRL